MSMYEFQPIGPSTTPERKFIPSEALYLEGHLIEDQIDGYQTLNVTGRELLGYTLNTVTVSGMDGVALMAANLPSRDIVVKYRLAAKDAEEFQQKYNTLRNLLAGKEMRFWFADDADWYYTGTMSAADIPGEGQLTVVSTFTLTCSDPHKYERRATVMQGSPHVMVRKAFRKPVVPDKISLTLSAAYRGVLGVYVTPMGPTKKKAEIRLKGNFPAGTIEIYPKEMRILVDGQDAMKVHVPTSDLENFAIETGLLVTTNVDAVIEVAARDVM